MRLLTAQFTAMEMGKWSLKRRSERTTDSHELNIAGEANDKSMTDLDWLGRQRKVGEPSLRQINE